MRNENIWHTASGVRKRNPIVVIARMYKLIRITRLGVLCVYTYSHRSKEERRFTWTLPGMRMSSRHCRGKWGMRGSSHHHLARKNMCILYWDLFHCFLHYCRHTSLAWIKQPPLLPNIKSCLRPSSASREGRKVSYGYQNWTGTLDF